MPPSNKIIKSVIMGSKHLSFSMGKVAIAILVQLTITQAACASSAIEVGRIAKAVTVMINSPQSTGSGVII